MSGVGILACLTLTLAPGAVARVIDGDTLHARGPLLGLVLVLLVPLAQFSDQVGCTVKAMVWHLDGDLGWRRLDACTGIADSLDADSVVLHSRHYWVRVVVPVAPGWRRFAYRWGAANAYIEGHTMPVEWGRVLPAEERQ